MFKSATISTIGIGANARSDLESILQSARSAYGSGDFLRSSEFLNAFLQEKPNDAQANNLLGLCALNSNRPDVAEVLFSKAIEVFAEADFYVNLGLASGRLGKQNAARLAYHKAIELDPQSWVAHKNLANTYYRNGQYREAAEFYKQACCLNPKEKLDAIHLADCLLRMQEDDAALEVYNSIGAWGYLQFEMRNTARWTNLHTIDAAYIRDLADGTASILPPPFRTLQMSGATALLQKRAAYDFGIQELPELESTPICPPRGIETGSRKIRIGYLSSDFFDHATMHLLAGVFEAHDYEKLDISVFCYSPIRDQLSERLRATGVSFVDIAAMSDQRAAQEIFTREIDILVDLKGYTASARLGITAMRPAPVIVNWLGYPGTMGHPRLADYIIGDAIVTPPENAPFFSERLALMPHSYQPNDRLRPLSEAPSRTAAGLPDEALIFCSFNQTAKFNPQTFDIWARLLLRVPNSVLWIPAQESANAQANLLNEMRERGVSENRIVFAPKLQQADHLARLRLADIALDTYPYNSHTTASDALWAAVPLVTLKGETFASRVASSLLATHGFSELIVESEDQYFELALELATNQQRRTALKNRLNEARSSSPLFDTVRFTRALEDLYRAIADDHNKPPALRSPFVISRGGFTMCNRATISTINTGATARSNLENILQSARSAYSSGDFLRASEFLNAFLQENPGDTHAYNLLGCCYLDLNKPEVAEVLFNKAISIAPESHFYLNLGLSLGQLGKQDAARLAYHKAIELDPQSWAANKNLANIYNQTQQYRKAVEFYKQTYRLKPESLREAIQLASCHLHLQENDEAFEIYRSIGAWGHLAFEMRNAARWEKLTSIDVTYLQGVEQRTLKIVPAPFQMLQVHGTTPAFEKHVAYAYSTQEYSQLRTPPVCAPRKIETGSRRMRIGYLSSDLLDHATMHLLAGVFEAHDYEKLDISVFCYSPIRDHVSERLRATGVSFVDVAAMSDQRAAQEIFTREIDILVDLKGYTASARLGITAMRPAPVIVNWLGYPGTMGHPRLADYIIGDAIVTPPENAPFFSERLALMPHSYQPNDRLRPFPEAPSRSEVGLPDDALIFCSFNQTVKFNPQTFDIWARLMLGVPDSVLWIPAQRSANAQANLLNELRKRGVSENRIVFAPNLRQADHLARLRLADIALDTFPYNSHTTASDALWAGVPLVTLKGETFASRVATSLLATHGFSELITETPDQYLVLAFDLATNSQRREAIKHRLHQARMTSPLFDTVRFTRNLEALYRAIAEDHNQPPEQRAPFVAV